MANMTNFCGNDTLELDGRLINDFADGDCVVATFEGEEAGIIDGKNGNKIITYTPGHLQVVIRVLTGQETERFLLLKNSQQKADNASYVGFSCNFTKKMGDGTGKTKKINITGERGFCKSIAGATTNSSNDASNGVAEYTLIFPIGNKVTTE